VAAIDEQSLWAKAKAGDPASFGDLFDLHYARVFGQALRSTGSVHDAEDVAALVFLEAWRKRSSVRIVDGTAIAWLLVTTNYVARNAARSVRRHHAAMTRLARELDRDEGTTDFEEPAEHELVRAAFARLSTIDQNILTLCVVNEFSLAQAAETLGVPLGTVKSRLSRAKTRLSQLTEIGVAR